MRWRPAILGIFAIQTICAVVFVFDIAVSVLGLRTVPITWRLRELIEIGAALGLILGTAMGIVAVRRSDARRRKVEDQLKVASGAFSALISQRFEEWSLTAAERDVALFSIKGLSLSEMAGLRGTSEGTIKAQTAAVYRKAGVTGRAQLLSLFVDDLMSGVLLPTPEESPSPTVTAAQ